MDRDKIEQIIMEELHNEGWRDNLGKATGAFKVAADKFKQFNLKQMGDFGEKVGNIGGRYVTRDPDKKNPRSWTRGQKRDAIIDFKLGVACRTTRAVSEDFGEEVNALIDEYFPIKKYGPTGQVCPKKKKKGGAAVNEKVGKTSVDRAGKNLSQKLQGMVDNYEDSDSETGGKKTWKNAYQAFDREMRENGMLYMLDSKTRIQFGKEMYQLWQQYGGLRTAAEDEQSARKGQEVRDQLRASLADQGLTPEQAEEVINAAIDQLKASDVPISEQFIAKFKTKLIERLSEEYDPVLGYDPDDKKDISSKEKKPQKSDKKSTPLGQSKEDDERDNLAAKVLTTVRKGEQRFYNIQTAAKSSAGLIAGFEFYRILLKLQKILDNDELTSDEGKQVLKKLSAFSSGGPIKMPGKKVPLPEEKEEDKSAGAKFGRPGSFKASKRAGPRPASAGKQGSVSAGRMTEYEKKLDKKISNTLETFEAFGLGANPETDPAKYKEFLKKVSKLKKGGPGEKVPLPGKDEKTAADTAPEKGKLKVSSISQKLASDGVDKEVIKKAMDALKKDLAPLLKQYNVKLSEQQKEIFKSKLREEIIRRELIK
jgi:SOS response regulatory protein OraA/RecX